MRSRMITALTVFGAVTILLLAGNTVALAATGKGFLLGKTNTTSKATTLKRTASGAALKVTTKNSTDAPLKVNGTGKVANLNADKIDGLDSSVLGTRALAWTFSGNVSGDRAFVLGGLPKGTYLVNYEVYLGALSASSGTRSNCFFRWTVGGNPAYGGETAVVTDAGVSSGISGQALITYSGTGVVDLFCNVPAGVTWVAGPSQPVRITAVPLAGVTNKGAPLNPTAKISARNGK